MSDTSIGFGPNRGSNENKDADPRTKTLGEHVSPDDAPSGADLPPTSGTPPARKEQPGAEAPAGERVELLDAAGPDLPAGVPGAAPHPGSPAEATKAFPDGPNVEASPWELDAARGKLPPR